MILNFSKNILSLIAISFTLFAFPAFAEETYRREIGLDWDPIEDATGYEVQIENTSTKKIYNYRSKDASWNGKLTPGSYTLKMRSLDYRGISGDWSDMQAFDVQLDTAKFITPENQKTLATKENNEYEMKFEWTPVPGAVKYKIEILNDDQTKAISKEITDTEFKADLKVANKYRASVTAVSANGIDSTPAYTEFTLSGQELQKPKIEKPNSEFVRTIYWEKSEYAEGYDIHLQRFDKQSKKWNKVTEIKDQKDESLPFDAAWPGGEYKIYVSAKGKFRKTSGYSQETFKVRGGDRSPASEFRAEVRKSIERFSGWYGIASYLITMMNYSGLDWDTGMNPKFSAVGGTGRLGTGWFVDEKKWGFLSILDMSGFYKSDEQKNVTFSSFEANAVYKTTALDRGEFRALMGMFYKEMPYILPTSAGASTTVASKIGSIGPHLGAEYWYSMTPKLGFQVNAHIYYNASKTSTPNDGSLTPTMSTQIGFLGSYRLSQKLTGLMGYAKRDDRAKFAATQSINPSMSTTNEVTISGNYLNFYAEYSF